MEGRVEFLAEEFKRMVGWGASPKRLPLLGTLASLANVPENASFVAAGYIIRRYLIEAIASVEDQEFCGRVIPGDKLQRVYRLLFQIEGTGLSAVNRRYRAIQLLGLPVSIDQWRRPYGPEWDLMLLLAEQLVSDRQTSA